MESNFRTPPRQQIPAPRLARAIVVVALAAHCVVTVLNVLHQGTGNRTQLIVCVGVVLSVFAVQFTVSSPRTRSWTLGKRTAALGVQALLSYLPLLWFQVSWGSMQGPLAATALLTLPVRLAWPAYGLIIAAIPPYALATGVSVVETCYLVIASGLTGLVIYGLSRLADLVQELHATREQMAKMAVTQERLRFARDLHDLLGYSLSAIALKGELIQRLVHLRPDQAAEETADLLRVARQALSDVRLVSSGYRDMSLCDEAESAGAVLAAADVRAEVRVECGRLHPAVDTVLATALREGVTNILRHSRVQVCTIRALIEEETVRLTLVNDRPHEEGGIVSSARRGGSGLDNLRTRFASIGGGLEAGVRDDGRFHLEAWAPLRPQSTGAEGAPNAAKERAAA